MDRGGLQTTVHRVTKSWAQLSSFTFFQDSRPKELLSCLLTGLSSDFNGFFPDSN